MDLNLFSLFKMPFLLLKYKVLGLMTWLLGTLSFEEVKLWQWLLLDHKIGQYILTIIITLLLKTALTEKQKAFLAGIEEF